MNEIGSRTKREQDIYDIGLDRRLWKKFFNNQGYYENQRRLQLFRKFLNKKPRKILELGGSMSKQYVYDNSAVEHSVTCVNISQKEIDESKLEYRNTRMPIFIQMDAHQLEFDDNSFDLVFGFGMLHHLDYEKTLSEVNRVLTPGGIAIFKEPLDENPVARLFRLFTPMARTEDEVPFRRKDLKKIERSSENVDFQFDQLFTFPFALISRLFSAANDTQLIKLGHNIDNFIERKIPVLRTYFRQVTIVIKKDNLDGD